jgi:MobL relaxases
MRVVFHIISTGGGGGVSRTTRYIAEREKDPAREGPGPRPLFSEDRDGLTYRKADRILDPVDGQPEKDDLMHLSVSFQEEDFEKLGKDEEERQAGLRRVIREGMKGMAEDLNVEGLTWVAGIHRNSENPHAHIVLRNQAVERGAVRETPIGKIRTSLLPHKQVVEGKEVIVPGKIGDRFLGAGQTARSFPRTESRSHQGS